MSNATDASTAGSTTAGDALETRASRTDISNIAVMEESALLAFAIRSSCELLYDVEPGPPIYSTGNLNSPDYHRPWSAHS